MAENQNMEWKNYCAYEKGYLGRAVFCRRGRWLLKGEKNNEAEL